MPVDGSEGSAVLGRPRPGTSQLPCGGSWMQWEAPEQIWVYSGKGIRSCFTHLCSSALWSPMGRWQHDLIMLITAATASRCRNLASTSNNANELTEQLPDVSPQRTPVKAYTELWAVQGFVSWDHRNISLPYMDWENIVLLPVACPSPAKRNYTQAIKWTTTCRSVPCDTEHKPGGTSVPPQQHWTIT